MAPNKSWKQRCTYQVCHGNWAASKSYAKICPRCLSSSSICLLHTVFIFLHLFHINFLSSLFFVLAGDSWIALSASTIALTRQYLSLLEDCLRLCTTELAHTVDQVLTDVYSSQLIHFEGSLQNEKIGNPEVSNIVNTQ